MGFTVMSYIFQVNSKKPVRMDFKRGYEEESFLKQLEVEPKDVEFLAENCTKVLPTIFRH